MGCLTDRVAIVTGAGQGVGLGVARAFAAEGAHVIVANRTRETGEAAAAAIERDFGPQGGSARFIEADVSSEASVRAMVGQSFGDHGRIDILVNNATPSSAMTRLEGLSNQDVQAHLDVNYLAVFWALQAVFPPMRAAGYGRIITMCSLNGINAHRYTAPYNGSKEAARALTRTAAVEWGRHGITANVICPFARSASWDRFEQFAPDEARTIVEGNPIRSVADPEADIGPLAVFLASEESRYITGNTIHADGGGHINGVAWQMELPE